MVDSNLYTELAPYYNLIVGKDTKKEITFLEKLFKENNCQKILDLACGNGRHAKQLDQKDYNVTGIDLSQEMLKQALKKSDASFVRGNLKELPLKQKFDAAILLWSTINLFTNKETVEKIFTEINRCLVSGGFFVLDAKPRQPDSKKESSDTIETEDIRIKIKSKREYKADKKKSVYHYDIYYKQTGKKKELKDTVIMQLFSQKELEKMLEKNNFKIKQKYGNYSKEKKYSNKSKRLILLCKKV